MSLASRLFTASVGLALIWFFWSFGGSDEVVEIATPPPTGLDRLFTTKLPEEAPAKVAPDSSVNEADVTHATGTKGEGKMAAAVAVPAKPKLTPKRFYRVRVLDSGTLKASGLVIKLDGISPIPSDETCKDSAGTNWFCGTRARMALTRFIRGRAVVCEVPENDMAKALTARCTLARKDLSLWVARQGWAKAAKPAEPKIAEATHDARKKKIGIWR
jgi:endonuclease YncB( thermonuclease family)